MNCRDLAILVASSRLREARWWVRWRARLHIRLCRNCAAYSVQVRWIDCAARDALAREAPSAADLARLETSILEQLDSTSASARRGKAARREGVE